MKRGVISQLGVGVVGGKPVHGATAALLVATVRLRLGTVLLLVATVGGLVRVAANVHHLQDIAAALNIAILATVAALTLSGTLTSTVQRARLGRLRRAETAAVPGQAGSSGWSPRRPAAGLTVTGGSSCACWARRCRCTASSSRCARTSATAHAAPAVHPAETSVNQW